MSYEEYVAEQLAISAALAVVLLRLLSPLRAVALGTGAWLGLLASMFAQVSQARAESAELARRFYDAERADKTGESEPHPMFLAEYFPDWFQEALEPARKTFSRRDATESSMAHVVSIALKEVENAGRRTILRAVDNDPRVLGWARVEGGQESCPFCTMLISRGPVYVGEDGARNAGLNADTTSAVEIWKQADETGDESVLMELMTRWHENCDCKVVPVFDRANWPGRDKYLEAERLWRDVTRGFTGSDKLRALREHMESSGTSEQDSPDRAAA